MNHPEGVPLTTAVSCKDCQSFLHSPYNVTMNRPPPSSLLVLAYGHGLGDSILALPFLSGVRKAWPGCRVTLATTAPTAAWFLGAGLVDEVVRLVDGGLWRHWKRLRARRFDLAVDLRLDHTVHSALFVRLLGARATVGFDCPLRGRFFSQRVRADYQNAHHVDNLSRFAETLGIPWSAEPPPVSLAACQEADALLARLRGVGEGPLVALAPGGRHDLARLDKRWPASFYADLARRLAARGMRVIVTGVSQEKELTGRIAREGGAADLTGLASCEVLAALFERCRLVVGNNSGPVHLADALKIPTLSFSGGVHMTHWRPRAETARVLLRDANCRESFCRLCPDKGEACLGRIDPGRVFEEAAAILRENGSHSEVA